MFKEILEYQGFTDLSPLWNNRHLQELSNVEKSRDWERCGLTRLSQLYRLGVFKSFLELREDYGISYKSFFKYLQVRHALRIQFKEKPPEWCEANFLWKIIDANVSRGLISFIYDCICDRVIKENEDLLCRRGWEEDLGDISNEQWKYIMEMGPLSTLSPSQSVSYLMLLHRAYKTPQK